MILIGEKLNSSIPSALEAFQSKDEQKVVELIRRQGDAGADYLDLNTAICGEDELDRMLWAMDLIQRHCSCGIMIDSTDPEVMAKAANAAQGRPLIFNSATITDRFQQVTQLALEYHAGIVGMPIDDLGLPTDLEDKCAKIDRLIAQLRQAGIPDEHIYVDVLVEALATDGESGRKTVDAIAHVSQNYPEVKTVCGLSNISFGLPRRKLVNSAFLAAALYAGLSSAILDPSSPSLRDTLAAARVVAGQDDYCMDYITYIREQEETQ